MSIPKMNYDELVERIQKNEECKSVRQRKAMYMLYMPPISMEFVDIKQLAEQTNASKSTTNATWSLKNLKVYGICKKFFFGATF